jgi:actin-related protein
MVKTFISNPENVRKAIAEFEKAKDRDKATNQEGLNLLLLEKEAVRKKKSNFLDLFGEERFNKQDLYAKIEPLEAHEILLDKQIGELTSKIRHIEETGQINKEIQKSCASYYSKVKNPNFELKKRIVRDWVKEINIMDDGAVKIKMRVPEVASSLLKISDNV